MTKLVEVAFVFPELIGFDEEKLGNLMKPIGKKLQRKVRRQLRKGQELSGKQLPDPPEKEHGALRGETDKLIRSIAYHPKEHTVRPRSGTRQDVGIRRGGNWALLYILINGYKRDGKQIDTYNKDRIDPLGVTTAIDREINEQIEQLLGPLVENDLLFRYKAAAVGRAAHSDLLAEIRRRMSELGG